MVYATSVRCGGRAATLTCSSMQRTTSGRRGSWRRWRLRWTGGEAQEASGDDYRTVGGGAGAERRLRRRCAGVEERWGGCAAALAGQ